MRREKGCSGWAQHRRRRARSDQGCPGREEVSYRHLGSLGNKENLRENRIVMDHRGRRMYGVLCMV